MVGYSAPLGGLSLAFGELLIDITSPWLFTNSSRITGGISNHVLTIPNDPALLGFPAFTQALLYNSGGGKQLTNALDLVLGSS